MNWRSMRRADFLRTLFALALLMAAPARAEVPTIAAAASLRYALDEAADIYAKAGGVRPRITYAASGNLVQQIRQGAPYGLFLSADEGHVALLEQAPLGPDRAKEASLNASLQAAKAKLVVDDLVLKSTSQMFEVGGASSAKRSENLDRHWRNARTLASHNPSIFKARVLGDYELNGTLPPNLAFF